MVASVVKRIAAQMPDWVQHELRRVFFSSQIRRRRFATDEKEYALLHTFLSTGDWALDIGANVGHYTLRMSELVGSAGRVIAFEPVPNTFALLAENVRLGAFPNVSLLNVAASDGTKSVAIDIPQFAEGMANYYRAQLSDRPSALAILTLPVDALGLTQRIKLVKIDVEGHELAVLRGMRGLIERDHPVLIVETASGEATDLLHAAGYLTERLPGSSNLLCKPA
jgi:FkbM family methyltransferase